MPGQLQRQLHAGRKFCKALVDAELEIEGAVLMAQHDRRRRPASRRRATSRSRTGRSRPAPTVARRTKAASPSSCPSAVPRLPFQPLASSTRKVSTAAATSAGVRATSKWTAPCSARRLRWRRSSFSFFAPSASRSSSSASRGRIEAGADMRLQHDAAHAVATQHVGEGLHGGAVERGVAQDQRMGAGLPRLPHECRRGVLRHGRGRAAACTACHRDRR